jgi:hypothetical protein
VIGQVVCDRQGRIIHFSCGYYGRSNDQLVVGLSGIAKKISSHFQLAADGGFSAKDNEFIHVITPTKTRNETEEHLQKVERVIVEIAIGHIKNFGILKQRFRQKITLLPVVALCCACVANMHLKENPIRTAQQIREHDGYILHNLLRNCTVPSSLSLIGD